MTIKSLFREFFFFGLAGVAGFVVDTGVLYLLKADLGNYRARAISFLCAVVVTWLVNRSLTFRHKSSQKTLVREFFHYLGMMLASGAVNYLTFVIVVSQLEVAHRQPVWGVVAGSLAGMVINYLQLRLLMFRHTKP